MTEMNLKTKNFMLKVSRTSSLIEKKLEVYNKGLDLQFDVITTYMLFVQTLSYLANWSPINTDRSAKEY